jgi:hypothetical protein
MFRRIHALMVALSVFTTPVYATTLFAGVSHSETLPALQTRAPYGATERPAFDRLNEGNQDAQPQIRVKWIKLPPWMAGVWTKKGDLTTSVTDLRTGITTPTNEFIEDVMTITYGHLKDSQGNIWHAFLLPSDRDGKSNGNRVVFKATEIAVQASAPEYLIDRVLYIVSEFDRQGTSIASFQQETLNKYVSAEGMLVNESSDRVFTYEGQPIKQGTLLSKFKKDADFTPTRELSGINLEESFAQFMRQSQNVNSNELQPSTN